MNYSSPDYGSLGQQDTYGNMSQVIVDQYLLIVVLLTVFALFIILPVFIEPSIFGWQHPSEQEPFVLTPEEKRVLQECSKEGIIQRGIPMGMVFGFVGLLGARAGPLMSKRWGVKPAVFGLGTLGYFLGRFSYSKTCMQRVLNVPDGNLRKIMIQKGIVSRENVEQPYNQQDPSNFYATIEAPKDQDQSWDSQRADSDISDMPGTSSFDTVPSDYYTEVDQSTEEIKPKSYTSYDDLRKRNRQDFVNRMYPETPRYGSPDSPQVVRPRIPETPTNRSGNHQTKYGDSWE